MTHQPRRSHSITVKFHDGKFSSVHWSPPRECWPWAIRNGVETLKRDMAQALDEGEVKEEGDNDG